MDFSAIFFTGIILSAQTLGHSFSRLPKNPALRLVRQPQLPSRQLQQQNPYGQQQTPFEQQPPFLRSGALQSGSSWPNQPQFGDLQPPNCLCEGQEGNMASSAAMSLNAAVFSQIGVLPMVVYCDNYGQQHSDLGRLANLLSMDQGMGLRPCVIGTPGPGGLNQSNPNAGVPQASGSATSGNLFNPDNGGNGFPDTNFQDDRQSQFATALIPTNSVCLTNQSTVSGDIFQLSRALADNLGLGVRCSGTCPCMIQCPLLGTASTSASSSFGRADPQSLISIRFSGSGPSNHFPGQAQLGGFGYASGSSYSTNNQQPNLYTTDNVQNFGSVNTPPRYNGPTNQNGQTFNGQQQQLAGYYRPQTTRPASNPQQFQTANFQLIPQSGQYQQHSYGAAQNQFNQQPNINNGAPQSSFNRPAGFPLSGSQQQYQNPPNPQLQPNQQNQQRPNFGASQTSSNSLQSGFPYSQTGQNQQRPNFGSAQTSNSYQSGYQPNQPSFQTANQNQQQRPLSGFGQAFNGNFQTNSNGQGGIATANLRPFQTSNSQTLQQQNSGSRDPFPNGYQLPSSSEESSESPDRFTYDAYGRIRNQSDYFTEQINQDLAGQFQANTGSRQDFDQSGQYQQPGQFPFDGNFNSGSQTFSRGSNSQSSGGSGQGNFNVESSLEETELNGWMNPNSFDADTAGNGGTTGSADQRTLQTPQMYRQATTQSSRSNGLLVLQTFPGETATASFRQSG
ncbi:hypothetical protein BV898_13837 [Hypsibius exemplaris]|uniref:Uncharacterized protein n=1 Tax=Hypsibius exemplaris TaxID=2072580 RepID=A0A1W0W9I5_HYPEX|nr:hypothetical protein BV898_13837 [Hypsibius exemplaris]